MLPLRTGAELERSHLVFETYRGIAYVRERRLPRLPRRLLARFSRLLLRRPYLRPALLLGSDNAGQAVAR
jgi:hypothetical protein